MEREVFRVFPDSHAELADRLHQRGARAESKQDVEEARRDFLADIMHLYFDALDEFDTLDESQPWLRAACGGLLTAGAICLSIPAALVFYRVACILGNLVAAYLGRSQETRSDQEHLLSHQFRWWDKNPKFSSNYSSKFRLWRSLGESNPCFSLERAAS